MATGGVVVSSNNNAELEENNDDMNAKEEDEENTTVDDAPLQKLSIKVKEEEVEEEAVAAEKHSLPPPPVAEESSSTPSSLLLLPVSSPCEKKGTEGGEENDGRILFVLPECRKIPEDILGPVEQRVSDAIRMQRESPSSTDHLPSVPYYREILAALGPTSMTGGENNEKDFDAVLRILIALRTADGVVCSLTDRDNQAPQKHNRLIHTILRFDPFAQMIAERRQRMERAQKRKEEEASKRSKRKKKKAKRSSSAVDSTEADSAASAADEDLSFEWDFAIADAYIHLMIDLATSDGGMHADVLKSFWRWLRKVHPAPVASVAAAALKDSSSNINGKKKRATDPSLEDPVFAEGKRLRSHAGMAKVIRSCGGSEAMFELIREHAPFKMRSCQEIARFYTAAMECMEYAASPSNMQRPLLQLMILKCIEMDVEIAIDDDTGRAALLLQQGGGGVAVDEKEGNSEEGVFAMDEEENIDAAQGDKNDKAKKDEEEAKKREEEKETLTVDEMAEKLDSIMTLLFEHSEDRAGGGGVTGTKKKYYFRRKKKKKKKTDDDPLMRIQNLYKIYRYVFQSSILVTYRSKFVQFIIMHICGLEVQLRRQRTQQQQQAPQQRGAALQSKEEEAKALALCSPLRCCTSATGCGDWIFSSPPIASRDFMYRDYCALLLGILRNPGLQVPLMQRTAVCYLASFVSRASYCDARTACESVSALLSWAEGYVDGNRRRLGLSTTACAASVKEALTNAVAYSQSDVICEKYGPFYTAVQGALYIMCFRGLEAVQFYRQQVAKAKFRTGATNDDAMECGDDDDDDVDIGLVNVGSAERWNKICAHPLQPLRYCLESVRDEFLHVAEVLRLLDEGALERLKRQAENDRMHEELQQQRLRRQKKKKKRTGTVIRTAATRAAAERLLSGPMKKERDSGGPGGLGQGSNPLQSFFPFDPYLLRRSVAHVEPFYRHWNGSLQIPPHEDSLGKQLEEEEEDDGPRAADTGSTVEENAPQDNEEDEENVHDGGAEGKDSSTFFVAQRDDEEGNEEEEDDCPFPMDTEGEEEGAAPPPVTPSAPSSPNSSTSTTTKTIWRQSSLPIQDEQRCSAAAHREAQKEAWEAMTSLKRTRAPSMENGSW